MKTITLRINKRSGKVTLKVEGCTGESCKELTKPIEDGLGMKDHERELLPEYYQQQEQQQQTT